MGNISNNRLQNGISGNTLSGDISGITTGNQIIVGQTQLLGLSIQSQRPTSGDYVLTADGSGNVIFTPYTGSGGGGGGFSATTLFDMRDLRDVSGITAGCTYKVIDANYSECVYLLGKDIDKIDNVGLRLLKMPKPEYYIRDEYSEISGIWNPNLGYSTGDLVVWGTRIFENNNGSPGYNTSDTMLNGGDWTQVPSDFIGYEIKQLECFYYWEDDYFIWCKDDKNNTISALNGAGGGDFTHLTDYNHPNIFNNNVSQILNNSRNSGYLPVSVTGNTNVSCIIKNNFLNGDINNNNVIGSIKNNEISSGITFNTLYEIRDNTNTGHISGNTGLSSINTNSNTGNISNNKNFTSIYDNNSNVLNIESNTFQNGSIFSNTNTGDIIFNRIMKDINTNANTGDISYNQVESIELNG